MDLVPTTFASVTARLRPTPEPAGEEQTIAVLVVHATVLQTVRPSCAVTVAELVPRLMPVSVTNAPAEVGALARPMDCVTTGES
jgi:hypothetical protein